jgi:hypothetical protein
MDVVSLLPSATEICYALDVEPVGVSHECDHPPAALSLPAMNYSVVDGKGTSADVNAAVATADREGNGVYAIDGAALADADPDLVLTQGVCDVCAVDRVLVADAVEDLDPDAEILTLDPHSLADVMGDVRRVGDQEAARSARDVPPALGPVPGNSSQPPLSASCNVARHEIACRAASCRAGSGYGLPASAGSACTVVKKSSAGPSPKSACSAPLSLCQASNAASGDTPSTAHSLSAL